MIEITNETNYRPNTNLLETIAAELTDRDIELVLTNNSRIREMNRLQRGVDAPTDVLSFPLEKVPFAPLGEIVISVEYAADKASQYGNSLDDEIALLFIHGLLHLLGYDHETDNGQMRRKEEELIRRFGLPESLIVRTEGSQ
ncbi:rRNA maturation RNase YbeY [Hydrogenimonas urashimensis]|uniref:rRNA maturation RNase YbeY n=1 Tax=Hydrogenimonas urashimensis TaxID=2740515 RepID=UPI00191535F0|nr:rRNA maturation RNase YbeY [Hydrogenimonas urashimensis]